MKLSMKYGNGELELQVPDQHFAEHVNFSGRMSEKVFGSSKIKNAVSELEHAGFVAAVRDRVVGLLVADATRERTYEGFLPALAPTLRLARECRVFICTGTHDPLAPDNVELAEHLRERLRQLDITARITVHDAHADDLAPMGTTTHGTALTFQPAAAECDSFLVLANMKYHYFAGYSNPVKYYLPGLCGYETARGNHSLTMEEHSSFGRHPWHPDSSRRDNPLAIDMVDGFAKLIGARQHFALAVVGTVELPAWCGGGRTEELAGRAMEVVDQVMGFQIKPSRFLVVSPGGHPHDESLYTAQRALELTRAAVRDGGEVLFLAACTNGIGTATARRNFFDPLTRPLSEVCQRPKGEYVMYSHKAYKFGLYLSGLASVWMHTELASEQVASIHLCPAPSAQAVIDEWVAKAQPEDVVTFIDDASKFGFYSADDPAQVPMP